MFFDDDEGEFDEYAGEEFGDDYAEEDEYKPEADAWERVGMPGGLGGERIFGVGVEADQMRKMQRLADKSVQTAEEKLKINIDITGRELMAVDAPGLSEGDLAAIIEKVDYTDKPQYLNPLGFILGYIASSGGKQISNEKFHLAQRTNVFYKEGSGAKPEDILRYARHWINI